MRGVFFTADTHFGHNNVIRTCGRPYADAAEMDEALIDNWNSVVGKKDTVYHLGDFSFLRPERTLEILKRLKGYKHLILGNHDARMKAHVRAAFDTVAYYKEISLGNVKTVMCHYPFMTWNKSHHGSYNLHGHSHGKRGDQGPVLRIDVGVDCWDYHPVSADEVIRTMTRRAEEACIE